MDEGGQRWLLKALREVVGELADELDGLDPAAEEWRPSADEWALRDVVRHLHAAEELALAQFQHLIQGKTTPLPLWDVESASLEEGFGSVSHHLRAFVRARRQTTMLLWELTRGEWENHGEHPYRGRISIGQIARDLAEHDLEHLWQIRQYKQRLAGGSAVEQNTELDR